LQARKEDGLGSVLVGKGGMCNVYCIKNLVGAAGDCSRLLDTAGRGQLVVRVPKGAKVTCDLIFEALLAAVIQVLAQRRERPQLASSTGSSSSSSSGAGGSSSSNGSGMGGSSSTGSVPAAAESGGSSVYSGWRACMQTPFALVHQRALGSNRQPVVGHLLLRYDQEDSLLHIGKKVRAGHNFQGTTMGCGGSPQYT
jgi:hypothetical protein